MKTENKKLAAALEYQKRGWPVFPLHNPQNGGGCSCGNKECKSVGKHPRTTHGFNDATTEPDQIEKWWNACPDANIGICTGAKSGLVVIDIDPRHGGDTNLLELERKHGKLPETVESLTGGGGRHILFQYPVRKIKTNAGELGKGIDIRADGGYIVAPPSTHVTGKSYEWEICHQPEDISLAPLPPWIESHGDDVKQDTHSKSWIVDALNNLGEGNRNETFTKLAGRLNHDGYTPEEIINLLQPHAHEVGFDQKELKNLVVGLCNRYPKVKGVLPTPNLIKLTSLKELMAEPEEVFDYLIEGLLPKGGLSLIVAKPKTGKSTLSRQIALAVARGKDCLGRKVQRGSVIYLALEERRADFKNHFKAMGALEDENILAFIGMAPSDCIIQLRAIAETKKPALIIVDTLARITKIKDLNDYSQTVSGLDPLLGIAREVGAHVMLLHHAKKGEGKGIDMALGSTALTGGVDTIICLNRTEEYRTIATIQRDGNDIPETILSFDPITKITSLAGTREEEELKRMERAILEFLYPLTEPIPETEIHQNIEGKRPVRQKALRKLVQENKVIRIGEGKKGKPYFYSGNTGFLVPFIEEEPENQNSWDEKELANEETEE
ncbi:bifunctional DNA primase/polymerase [bacterium]|nr:bifunctional DNA primase/polymerase [bacterium]